ncbi:hypothetical protein [Fodinicurvata sp. EGI_FJ10296]|uniref:hypothetical protein n=1 Tax=Fodinicurvata sp. EGI_FJ10296 TaxID=3231908 RepID=UPI0034563337
MAIDGRPNPLRLNPLQCKTLAILQGFAEAGHGYEEPDGDGYFVGQFPQPHGNHMHVGQALVMMRDATGLTNPAVFTALERKGLIRSAFPMGAVLTPAGREYVTGVRDRVLHQTDHHGPDG